jgi:protein involved in polysaccharide export with SLBB domain
MPFRTTTPGSTLLFGLDIAGTVADAIGAAGGVTPAVLIKRGPRARATADPANGTRSTDTRIPCQAIVDGSDAEAAVTLLGASIVYQGARVVPEAGDAIEVRGRTMEIGERPEADPAAATYTCRAAGAARVLR